MKTHTSEPSPHTSRKLMHTPKTTHTTQSSQHAVMKLLCTFGSVRKHRAQVKSQLIFSLPLVLHCCNISEPAVLQKFGFNRVSTPADTRLFLKNRKIHCSPTVQVCLMSVPPAFLLLLSNPYFFSFFVSPFISFISPFIPPPLPLSSSLP